MSLLFSRDFTYIDDIVEGVVRVIDMPPAQGNLEARVPDSVRLGFGELSENKDSRRTNPDENREELETEGNSRFLAQSQ